jgi:hypothetical protein
MEGVMSRLLFASMAGLLAFSGLAWADGSSGLRHDERGTVVLWRGIAALQGHEQIATDSVVAPNLVVGKVNFVDPNPGWYWLEGGKASLNVDTGRFRIEARYVSFSYPTEKAPIGAILGGAEFAREARFVCNSLGLYDSGASEVVNTEEFHFDETGSINLSGVIHNLPQICHDYPDQIAFLIGGAGKNNYFLFGTGRAVLTGY